MLAHSESNTFHGVCGMDVLCYCLQLIYNCTEVCRYNCAYATVAGCTECDSGMYKTTIIRVRKYHIGSEWSIDFTIDEYGTGSKTP